MKSKISTCVFMVLIALIGITCKKPADKVFNGNFRVRGVVLFQNYLTGTQDTASTAVLTLTQTGNTDNPYVETLTNGTYDIQSLSGGNYTFTIRFDYKQPGSSKTDHYTGSFPLAFTSNPFIDQNTLVLTLDSVATPTLQIKVYDANGALLPAAQVSLYNSATVLAANRGTSNGSIASIATNQSGIAVFSNLQIGSYYVAVNAVEGSQIVNNASVDQVAVKVTSTKTLTKDSVSVSSQGGALQLLVTDMNANALANVNVALYTDTSLLSKYRGTGTGALRAEITNSQGIIVFANLQKSTYYTSVYETVGTDSINNKTTDTHQPLLSDGITISNYTIKLSKVVSTWLKINVTDAFMANISGAQVCLYTDTTLLSKFRGTCNGSLISGQTDANGNITFPNLQSIKYYVSAYKAIGTDTLSNKKTDESKSYTPVINQITGANITVNPK